MYYNVLKFPGFFYSLFQHSATSSSFITLCQNQSVSKNKPLSCINQEICGQKTNLYANLWKILTFMNFCGDYYDVYEN